MLYRSITVDTVRMYTLYNVKYTIHTVYCIERAALNVMVELFNYHHSFRSFHENMFEWCIFDSCFYNFVENIVVPTLGIFCFRKVSLYFINNC